MFGCPNSFICVSASTSQLTFSLVCTCVYFDKSDQYINLLIVCSVSRMPAMTAASIMLAPQYPACCTISCIQLRTNCTKADQHSKQCATDGCDLLVHSHM